MWVEALLEPRPLLVQVQAIDAMNMIGCHNTSLQMI